MVENSFLGCNFHCIIKGNVFDPSMGVQTPMMPQPPVVGFQESVIAFTFAEVLCSPHYEHILVLVKIGQCLKILLNSNKKKVFEGGCDSAVCKAMSTRTKESL